MNRQLIAGASLGLALFLAAYCIDAEAPKSKISPESFKKLRIGMTFEQVKEILGPPRDECNGGKYITCPTTGCLHEIWKSRQCQISISFPYFCGGVIRGGLFVPDATGETPGNGFSRMIDEIQPESCWDWIQSLFPK